MLPIHNHFLRISNFGYQDSIFYFLLYRLYLKQFKKSSFYLLFVNNYLQLWNIILANSRLQQVCIPTLRFNIFNIGYSGISTNLTSNNCRSEAKAAAKIEQATCLVADVTGINNYGKYHWAYTWKNYKLTCILCVPLRGTRTIKMDLTTVCSMPY